MGDGAAAAAAAPTAAAATSLVQCSNELERQVSSVWGAVVEDRDTHPGTQAREGAGARAHATEDEQGCDAAADGGSMIGWGGARGRGAQYNSGSCCSYYC